MTSPIHQRATSPQLDRSRSCSLPPALSESAAGDLARHGCATRCSTERIRQQIVQVAFAEGHKPIQAFPFDTSNESFAAPVQTRTRLGQRIGFHSGIGERFGKLLGDHRIAIVNHDLRLGVAVCRLIEERLCLLHNPCRVRVFGCRRDDRFSRLLTEERQHIHLPQALLRQGHFR